MNKQDGGESIRLNRFIARSGVCSRREADDLIAGGAVRVNGETVTAMGTRVVESDEVLVHGRHIRRAKRLYVLLNKPEDCLTTVSDERGRKTVMDLVKAAVGTDHGVFPVGRLDRDTTGVLLLTNDGQLAHRLMHPSFEIEKIYTVRTKYPVSEARLEELKRGVVLEDGPAAADRAEYVSRGDAHDIGLSIHEGRNRQIRRMFEAIDNEVVKLRRVRYAGLTTDGVPSGTWRRLTEREITRLYKLVKL